MKILITGASGLIGHHLTEHLLHNGHKVAHLGRRKTRDARVKHFLWNIDKESIDVEAVQWAEAIIHLAGASVSDEKWTEKRKTKIIDSRVKSAELLSKTIQSEKNDVKVIVSASGVGWYGANTSDKIFKEEDSPASDFLGECCKQWETSADLAEKENNIRVVKLRIGVVLAKEGGALPKLAASVKYFVGSPLGSGKQWMPWIHIDDLCELFLKAITDKQMSGSYNSVSGEFITNKEFVKSIGQTIGRPVFLPAVPKFILKWVLGEMSVIVTEGSRVSNEKILKTGFVFKYNELAFALKNLLN